MARARADRPARPWTPRPPGAGGDGRERDTTRDTTRGTTRDTTQDRAERAGRRDRGDATGGRRLGAAGRDGGSRGGTRGGTRGGGPGTSGRAWERGGGGDATGRDFRKDDYGRSRGAGPERDRDKRPPRPAWLDEELPIGEILPPEALDELRGTARPTAFRQAGLALAHALVALADEDDERAVEAAKEAKRLAPRSAAVREAYGLGLYRTGAFGQARTELAAAQRISGTADLSALLADIERALSRPEKALELFEQADRAAMSADAAAELLVVAASAYGDLGRPATGVALIRRHGEWPQQLREHHLRLAYVQGLLAEQAGDTEAALTAFGRVVAADPDYFDAAHHLDELGAG